MKTIFLILFLIIPLIAFSQDATVTMTYVDPTVSYQDTLTHTRDTVDYVTKQNWGISWMTVTAWTTTGTDTIDVYVKPLNGTYVQHCLIDMTPGTTVTQIIVSTTPKRYYIYAPFFDRIRLLVPDVSASVVVRLDGRR